MKQLSVMWWYCMCLVLRKKGDDVHHCEPIGMCFVGVCVFCLCLCLDLSCTTSTPFGTMDQAISCSKKSYLMWRERERERECCIIFKSQPLGSVKTSDEYRKACGDVYLLVSVCTRLCLCVQHLAAVLLVCFCLKGLHPCVWVYSHGLWGHLLTADTGAKVTSVKVIHMK